MDAPPARCGILIRSTLSSPTTWPSSLGLCVVFFHWCSLAWLWTSRLFPGRPGWSWALCLRNAWFDSGYMFCHSWWYFYGISYVKVDSDPEDNCTVSLVLLRSSSTTAVACILLVLLLFIHLVRFLRLSAAGVGEVPPSRGEEKCAQ